MHLDLNGRTINYKVSGNGVPFLLVHGWGGSSESLEALAKLLSANYKTITIDLPGFGLSSKPYSDWGVGEYAKLLIDFLDQLKLTPINFFGHSFGGALGISIASKYPNHISKLILSGPSYKRNPPVTTKIGRLFSWSHPIVKKIFYKILFPPSDLYAFPKLESNFRKIVNQDLTPLLSSIKTPTLILWGEEDKETPVPHAYELEKKIKNSLLKIFPGIGHNLPLKYPQKVNEEIGKFL